MHIVVLITAKDAKEANDIVTRLIDDKLIACANIVRDVRSIFRWEGKVDAADEVLLVLKTKKKCFAQLVETVKSVHSYDVPEIIALPIIDGNADYLKWIEESCS